MKWWVYKQFIIQTFIQECVIYIFLLFQNQMTYTDTLKNMSEGKWKWNAINFVVFFYHFPWIIPFKNVHCFTSETHFHGGREKNRRQPSIKMKNLESRKCGAHFFIPWYIKNQLWLGLYHKGKCMVLFFDIRWCSMFDLPYSFLCHHKIFIFIWKQIKINFCVTFNNVCGFYACVLFYIYFHLMPQSTHFL